MVVATIEKYGIVPAYAMPETAFSGHSAGFQDTLDKLLREQGGQLHKAARGGESAEALQKQKTDILNVVGSILQRYLGTPPQSFVWKDPVLGEFTKVTPLEFAKLRGLGANNQAVHLTHLPHRPLNARITYEGEEQWIGAPKISSLNLPLAEIKSAIRRSIIDGVPVYFYASMSESDENEINTLMLNPTMKKELLGLNAFPKLNKAERLNFGVADIDHGMLLVGCDDEPSQPESDVLQTKDGTWQPQKKLFQNPKAQWTTLEDERKREFQNALTSEEAPIYGPKWKVQNSWDCFSELYMTDEWFDEYVYGAQVDAKYLSKQALDMQADPFLPQHNFKEPS